MRKDGPIFALNLFVIFFVTLLIVAPSSADAKPVYKWKDANGVTHFTSQKPFQGAKPAELPEIMRGEMKLAKTKVLTCKSHGGTDCQAGADKDGSVICYDGFRGATTRFRLTCKSPKLEIMEISDLTEDGTFKVMVRNAKPVDANDANLYYKPELGKEVRLKGPDNIEAFGVAEFQFFPKDADIPKKKVELAQLDVTCGNCSK